MQRTREKESNLKDWEDVKTWLLHETGIKVHQRIKEKKKSFKFLRSRFITELNELRSENRIAFHELWYRSHVYRRRKLTVFMWNLGAKKARSNLNNRMKAKQLIMTWLLLVSMNSFDGGPAIFGRFHEQTIPKKKMLQAWPKSLTKVEAR